MIDRIIRDVPNVIFDTKDGIFERLNYFKELSKSGLHKLSEEDLTRLAKEFQTFYNIHVTLNADTYPTQLFRVTRNKFLRNGKKQRLNKVSELIGPPPEFARIGRCNLTKESVFYASLHLGTAIWEMQPEKGEYITVSEWKIKDGAYIRNHFIFHPEETNPSEESQKAREARIELTKNNSPEVMEILIELERFIAEEFMKPVDRAKNADYLFSAIVASNFLQSPPDENGYKVESVSYPSTRRDHKVTNMAITNSLVFEKLDLVSITLYDITETNYDSNNQEAVDLLSVSPLIIKASGWDIGKNEIYYDSKKELQDVIRLIEEGKLKHGH